MPPLATPMRALASDTTKALTEPLLALFEEKNLLLTIDGNRAIEEVHRSICEGLHLQSVGGHT